MYTVSWFDKKVKFLITAVVIECITTVFIRFCPENLCAYKNTFLQQNVTCLITFFSTIGTYEILRYHGLEKKLLYIPVFSGIVVISLLCGYFLTFITAFLAFFMNTFLWWAIFFFSVELLFSGCCARVKKWTEYAVVSMLIITDIFVFSIFDTYHFVKYFLSIIPLILLIFLCTKYIKQINSKKMKHIIYAYMGLSVLMVTANVTAFLLRIKYQYLVYLMLPSPLGIVAALLFSILFKVTIGALEKSHSEKVQSIEHNRENILIMIAVILVLGLLLLNESMIMVMMNVLIVNISLLLYEINKAIKHKKGEISEHQLILSLYMQVMNQNKEVASFLHDEVLQDLFAAKMLLSLKNENGKDNQTIIALENLQQRVRDEMESYNVQLERNLSYRENVEIALYRIKKRYQGKEISVNLHCSDYLILKRPFDSLCISYIKELVNNVYKHSSANACDVSIYKEKDVIVLVVEDNGAPKTANEKENYNGFGLMSIKHQVIGLGGDFIAFRNAKDKFQITIKIKEWDDENESNNF